MDLPRQPTGGIFQGLALFAIFFDLREAAFSTFSFWGRARMYVIFLVWYVPVRTARAPFPRWMRQVESSRFPEFQGNRPADDGDCNSRYH